MFLSQSVLSAAKCFPVKLNVVLANYYGVDRGTSHALELCNQLITDRVHNLMQ